MRENKNMSKGFSTKLSGQIGESLVVAELGRRGILATAFAGNVPEIDLLAFRNNKAIPIQVKALRSGTLRTKADAYLDIEFDGKAQKILGKRNNKQRNLIFIIVKLGQRIGEDVFYVCEQGLIQDLVFKGHSSFLEKHGGIRPRNPASFDCSVSLLDLEPFEGRWDLVSDTLATSGTQ